MMYVVLTKNFYLDDSNKLIAVRLISAFWAEKTFYSFFLEMVYVEIMKNIHLTDSNEVITVGLISAYWAQKCLIPTF